MNKIVPLLVATIALCNVMPAKGQLAMKAAKLVGSHLLTTEMQEKHKESSETNKSAHIKTKSRETHKNLPKASPPAEKKYGTLGPRVIMPPTVNSVPIAPKPIEGRLSKPLQTRGGIHNTPGDFYSGSNKGKWLEQTGKSGLPVPPENKTAPSGKPQ